jgi:hypothetical protein
MFHLKINLMKKIALTLCALALVTFAIAQIAFNHAHENKLMADAAVFEWNSTTFDFGKISAGTPVTHEFTFRNTGAVPLIISSAQASCGCTVTSYSKEPIPSGAQGFVTGTYNAAKAGRFTKTITVNSNTEGGAVILTITGEVTE